MVKAQRSEKSTLRGGAIEPVFPLGKICSLAPLVNNIDILLKLEVEENINWKHLPLD